MALKRWRERPLLCKIGIHSRCHNWPHGDFCNNCFIDLPPYLRAASNAEAIASDWAAVGTDLDLVMVEFGITDKDLADV